MTESTHGQMSYNEHQMLLPECLKIKKPKKQPQQKKGQTQTCPALFCLINVVYTLKAAHRDAVIHIMKALRKGFSNLPRF